MTLARYSYSFQKAFNINKQNQPLSSEETSDTTQQQQFPYTYLLLTSREQKCVSIETTKGSTLSINYNAPQLQVNPQNKNFHQKFKDVANTGMNAIKDQMKMHHTKQREMMEQMGTMNEMDKREYREWKSNTKPDEDDDDAYDEYRRDPHYHDRMNHRYNKDKYKDKHKDRKYNDKGNANGPNANTPLSNIKVTIEETIQKLDHKNHHRHPDHPLQSFTLVQKESRLRYTIQHTNYAKICIQSHTAHHHNPTFFSFRIKELDDVQMEHDLESVNQVDGLTDAERQQNLQNANAGSEHFKWLERELLKLVNRVNSVERACRVSKEEHGEFYETSVDMERALKWFAVVQLGVLVLTGVLNFRFVIRFLKRKGFVY